MSHWNGWAFAILWYAVALLTTSIPIVISLVRKASTDVDLIYKTIAGVDHLDEAAKRRIRTSLDLLSADLIAWNKLGQVYRRFQFYSVTWTILASVLVPILAQAIDGSVEAKWFLTLVSVHASLLLAFNKGLSVDDKVKLYRDAQNDLSDL